MEYDSSNHLLRSYVHGPNIDEPLELTTYNLPLTTYYYIADGLRSVTHILDSNGNLV